MKNANKYLLVIFLGLATNSLWAQQGSYFSIKSGYAFGINQETTYSSITEINYATGGGPANSTYTYENMYMSFGAGMNTAISYGYLFNENTGFEVGFALLKGKQWNNESTSPYNTFHNKSEASSKNFNASFLYQFNSKKAQPYLRMGVVLGTSKIQTESHSISEFDDYEWHIDYFGGMSFGAQSAMGLNFNLGSKVAIFGEVNLTSMAFQPKESKYTKIVRNGQDEMQKEPRSRLETVYVKEIRHDYDYEQNENEPSEELGSKMPMSSVAFNFGIKFQL